MTDNATTDKPSTFSEMKKIQSEYAIHHNKKIETNKNKYDDVFLNFTKIEREKPLYLKKYEC
jgi:hypothetical protein